MVAQVTGVAQEGAPERAGVGRPERDAAGRETGPVSVEAPAPRGRLRQQVVLAHQPAHVLAGQVAAHLGLPVHAPGGGRRRPAPGHDREDGGDATHARIRWFEVGEPKRIDWSTHDSTDGSGRGCRRIDWRIASPGRPVWATLRSTSLA